MEAMERSRCTCNQKQLLEWDASVAVLVSDPKALYLWSFTPGICSLPAVYLAAEQAVANSDVRCAPNVIYVQISDSRWSLCFSRAMI